MNPKNQQLSPPEWQLLSAYLDDHVSPGERIQIEEKLASDDAFRQALLSLRQTRTVIRSMPRRRVPRNFTLTPDMVPARRTLRLFPLMRLSSAFAAIAAVVLFAMQLLPGLRAASAPMAAPAAMELTAAQAPASTEPPLILWGDPALAKGMGGGGGGGDAGSAQAFPGGMGGGAPDTVYGMPSNAATPGIQFEIPQPTSEAGIGGAAVLPSQTPVPTPDLTATPVPQEMPAQPTAAPEEQRGLGTSEGNPILGLRPQDSGKVIDESQPAADLQSVQNEVGATPVNWMLPAAIGLALLAVLTAVAAWILWKKSRT